MGIAVSPLDGADAEALLHAADVAMYRGKKEGRGTFRFFEPAMDSELKARAQMEQELRAAVASGEIQPFFQPLVSLRNRELLGFEVLARWNHPTRGLISPVQFIQLAEDSGLISELSYSVWRQACLEARDWPAHLQLAVNVSPHQLTDRGLPERILAILTETGFAREAGGGDHRDGPGQRHRGGPRHPELAAQRRHPCGAGRLRNRLFEPVPPARIALRQDQDRPQLQR